MKTNRACFLRCFIYILMATCLVLGTSSFSFSSDKYPSRPISIFVGYAAGGLADFSTRTYASTLEKILGQPVVVINKPGGSGAIMMEFVKQSQPDGYILGAYGSGVLAGSHIREVPHHFFDDFTQITQICQTDMTLTVHADAPWKTTKDLIEYGQKNPGKLRWGSPGIGGSSHMTMERFAFLNNFKFESVPFDGDSPAVTALLGGHVDAITSSFSAFGHLVKAGRLRILGVFSQERFKTFPDVPTMKEQGVIPHEYKFAVIGLNGPKNLPTNVVETLVSAMKAATRDPNFIKLMDGAYVTGIARSGQEWIEYLKEGDADDVETMRKIGFKIIRDAYKFGGKPVK